MKTKLHRWLAWLMVAMLFVSMTPTSVFAETSGIQSFRGSYVGDPETVSMNEAEQKLLPYIRGKVTDNKDGDYSIGLSVQMALSYAIPTAKLIADDGSLYNTWTISRDELQLSEWKDFATSGKVYDGTRAVGEYNVDGGKVVIKFNDDFMKTASKSENGIEGTITVGGTWKQEGHEGETSWETQIGNSTITVYPNGLGDASVEKSVEKFNAVDKTITWKVKVSSKTGTYSDITLTDVLPGSMELVAPEVKVQLAGSVEELQSCDFTQNGQNVTVTLPQLDKNQDHYVYFYTKVKDGENPTIVENTVGISTDDAKGGKITPTSKATQSFKRGVAWKDFDDYCNWETGMVGWKVQINPYKDDIAGSILSDKITRNGALEPFSLAGVTVYKDKNAQTEATEGIDYIRTADGKIMFKATNADGTNTNQYWMYYETAMSPAGSNDQAEKNKGKYAFYDRNVIYMDGIGDDAEFHINKGTNVIQKDSTTFNQTDRTVTYTIKVNKDKINIAGMKVSDSWEGNLPKGASYVVNSGKLKIDNQNVEIGSTASISDLLRELNSNIQSTGTDTR